MEERPNTPLWKSYVWHKEKCFFVSTIERTYDLLQGSVRGLETIVWEYDWDKAERGKMIDQSGGIKDHIRTCHCLIAEGIVPDENNPLTARFFDNNS